MDEEKWIASSAARAPYTGRSRLGDPSCLCLHRRVSSRMAGWYCTGGWQSSLGCWRGFSVSTGDREAASGGVHACRAEKALWLLLSGCCGAPQEDGTMGAAGLRPVARRSARRARAGAGALSHRDGPGLAPQALCGAMKVDQGSWLSTLLLGALLGKLQGMYVSSSSGLYWDCNSICTGWSVGHSGLSAHLCLPGCSLIAPGNCVMHRPERALMYKSGVLSRCVLMPSMSCLFAPAQLALLCTV